MFYTLEKTAEMLDLSTGDVTRLRESNKLRGFRDGQTWKFRKEDVDKYLQDMIRERSRANDLLAGEQDETNPTMLADSASFDSLLDAYSFNDTADEPVADPVVSGVDELITDSVDSVDDLGVDALVTDGADSTDSLIAEMVGSNIPGSDNAEDDLRDDANDVPTSATDSPTISDAPTDASLLTDRTEDDLSGDSKDLSSSEFDAPTISATGSPTISETDAPTISDAPTDASLLTDRTEDDLSGDSKDLSSSEIDAPTLYDDVQGASGVASGVVESLTTDDDLVDSNGDAPALGAQSETSGENDEPMDESKDAPAVVAQSEASSEDDDLMIVADEDSS
ncbi:MAG: helix-turn-helix domain-containing protein, partial [Planctomycetia bacterium]|nr:helix-turn-helix domain-containing protein [Planctomycetia bacterium]